MKRADVKPSGNRDSQIEIPVERKRSVTPSQLSAATREQLLGVIQEMTAATETRAKELANLKEENQRLMDMLESVKLSRQKDIMDGRLCAQRLTEDKEIQLAFIKLLINDNEP